MATDLDEHQKKGQVFPKASGFPETKAAKTRFLSQKGFFPDNDRPEKQKSSDNDNDNESSSQPTMGPPGTKLPRRGADTSLNWTNTGVEHRRCKASREQNKKATPGGGKKEPGEYYIYDNC